MTSRTVESPAEPVSWEPGEMMTIAAARELAGRRACFVGIGLPSVAANLARLLHAPELVLVYESGTIGAKPAGLPLSIGDGELADTADAVVSVPEIFNYWLQPGRIEVGMLSGAQVDRFGNLNTTVIGSYRSPRVRLPGAGGAPEIAAACPSVLLLMRQSPRTFVEHLDFVTSVGFFDGGDGRRRLGFSGRGPQALVTDIGVLRPDPERRELRLTELHPGCTVEQARQSTGWPLLVSPELAMSEPPTAQELALLRRLEPPDAAR